MMEYKLEELKFYHMKKKNIFTANPRTRDSLKIFEIEKTLTEEEKLAFIDQQKNGVGTYMLNLIHKWESEKGSLPQNQYKKPKTVSQKAWIKRNDPREIIDTTFTVGKYWLFGQEFKELNKICPTTDQGYDREYTGQSIVHQWFHLLCVQLYQQEVKYFKENDPKQIKISKVKEYGNYLGVFDNEDLNNVVYNRKTDVEEARLDEFIAAFEELEMQIKKISAKLNK